MLLKDKQKGFALLEVIFAVGLLSFSMASLLQSHLTALKLTKTAELKIRKTNSLKSALAQYRAKQLSPEKYIFTINNSKVIGALQCGRFVTELANSSTLICQLSYSDNFGEYEYFVK